MSSGGENSSLPPSPKKARMSPIPPSSSWLPSCDNDTTSQGEQESCASVDSGLSDSATPPHDSVTPPVLPTNTRDMPEIEGEDRDDDLSSLSGLSDMSGQEWKPDMSGKLAWLHRAMASATQPTAACSCRLMSCCTSTVFANKPLVSSASVVLAACDQIHALENTRRNPNFQIQSELCS